MSDWECVSCTFVNSSQFLACQMCDNIPKKRLSLPEVLSALRQCFNVDSVTLKVVDGEGCHAVTSSSQLARLQEEMAHWNTATISVSSFEEDREVADLKQRVIFLENQLARLSRSNTESTHHRKASASDEDTYLTDSAESGKLVIHPVESSHPTDEFGNLLRECWQHRQQRVTNAVQAALGFWMGELVLAFSHPFDELLTTKDWGIDPFAKPNSLRLLDLTRAPLLPAMMSSLCAALVDNTSLTSLNLSAVHLPEPDLLLLTASLVSCRGLQFLDLSSTTLGDPSCASVCSLVSLLPLRTLLLDNNYITSSESIVTALSDPGSCLERVSLLLNSFEQDQLFALLQAMGGNTRVTHFGASSRLRYVKHAEFNLELPIYLERNRDLCYAREQRLALVMGFSRSLGPESSLVSLPSSPLFDARAFGLVWAFLFPQPPGPRLRALLQQLKQEHEQDLG